MARVDTGHIHLGSSIRHHTEGWETKSVDPTKKREAETHRNTQLCAHLHVCVRTNKEEERHRSAPLVHGRMQPYGDNLNDREHTLFLDNLNPTKIFTDTHTHTHTHTRSTFQPKMMKYEMEHYRLEWQSAQDCAGPPSHCLLLPETEKGEKKKKRGRNS